MPLNTSNGQPIWNPTNPPIMSFNIRLPPINPTNKKPFWNSPADVILRTIDQYFQSQPIPYNNVTKTFYWMEGSPPQIDGKYQTWTRETPPLDSNN